MTADELLNEVRQVAGVSKQSIGEAVHSAVQAGRGVDGLEREEPDSHFAVNGLIVGLTRIFANATRQP